METIQDGQEKVSWRNKPLTDPINQCDIQLGKNSSAKFSNRITAKHMSHIPIPSDKDNDQPILKTLVAFASTPVASENCKKFEDDKELFE